MAYYSGIIEHDTGMHADAEQQATGQLMMKVEITLSEYRDLVEKSAVASHKLGLANDRISELKQKLYEALKVLDADSKLTAEQKADFQKLLGDYSIKK